MTRLAHKVESTNTAGIDRRAFLSTLGVVVLAAPLAAEGQSAKITRLGFLSLASGPTPTMDLMPGLRALGWTEGQNIAIEYRWAANREDRLASLAAELVRLKVDILVTSSTPAALAAKRATATIPIVATFVADPVGSGLVASLARPGGNITGLTTLASGLVAKRLELLKDVLPESSRVAVLWQPGVFGEHTIQGMTEETQTAARALGLTLQFIEVRRSDDVESTLSAMRKSGIEGVLVFPSPMFFESRRTIVTGATKHRLPIMFPWREAAVDGGLMAYSTNFPDMYRRAATFVDKILKGAKPADLPVEQPTKFELVINLKTAKVLGLTIPPSLLLRADQVLQ
jgi:putative ABC transport system substrate-binding protein